VEIAVKTIENWRNHRRKSAKGHTIKKEKWREILKIVHDVTLFCARNNIAFRGTNEITGHLQTGLFLNLIKLISHYNPLRHIKWALYITCSLQFKMSL
jgi:hypothetical protein